MKKLIASGLAVFTAVYRALLLIPIIPCVALCGSDDDDRLEISNQIDPRPALLVNLRKGPSMNKFITTAVASTMLLSASTAFAGGPIIIEEEVEVIVEKPASSIGLLPLLLIPIILCVALCGGDDDEELPPPPV